MDAVRLQVDVCILAVDAERFIGVEIGDTQVGRNLAGYGAVVGDREEAIAQGIAVADEVPVCIVELAVPGAAQQDFGIREGTFEQLDSLGEGLAVGGGGGIEERYSGVEVVDAVFQDKHVGLLHGAVLHHKSGPVSGEGFLGCGEADCAENVPKQAGIAVRISGARSFRKWVCRRLHRWLYRWFD